MVKDQYFLKPLWCFLGLCKRSLLEIDEKTYRAIVRRMQTSE